MWSEPEAVSEVLLYDPAFLDPSLPTGFWFCADPEDVLAVQVNAGCLRTLGSWEYIGRYLRYLEQAGVLSPGESYAEVDYDRQLKWLNDTGIDTSAMTEQQVLEYQTGSWVFIRCGGRLVDAMEDFEVLFNNL